MWDCKQGLTSSSHLYYWQPVEEQLLQVELFVPAGIVRWVAAVGAQPLTMMMCGCQFIEVVKLDDCGCGHGPAAALSVKAAPVFRPRRARS